MSRRIDQLRSLAREYGKASLEYHEQIWKLGESLVPAVNAFLGVGPGDRDVAAAVPPEGEWDPEGMYRHDAFSGRDRLLELVPVEMGLSIRLDNLNDRGAFWVRLIVTFKKSGSVIQVEVGEEAPVRIPAEGWKAADLEEVCAKVETALRNIFQPALDESRFGLYGGGRIGFRTTS